MPDLIAYDSTRPWLIPADAAGILIYADGKFAWPRTEVDRFPHARRRHVTVLGDSRIASVCDVENGDVPPVHAPDFIRDRQLSFPGELPTIYCNRSTLPAVQAACEHAGPHGRPLAFNVWLSTLDGSRPTSIEGLGHLVAVQFEGGVDADFDSSVVWDHDWLMKP